MKTKFPSLAPLFSAALLVMAFVHPGEAADQVVTDLRDNGGPNQLRAKLTACLNSGGGTITFSIGGLVTVNPANGPLPTITGASGISVTVDGGSRIEISGNDGTRIFNVSSGATLTLRNLSISHAYSASGDGGAVASTGAVNAENTKFLYNQTSVDFSGSAILCWGPLNITNCEFAFNTGGGGAVKPRSSGAVTNIKGSNFHDNSSTSKSTATGYGGAMQVFDGPSVAITTSAFTNNSAYREGGAIFMTANSTVLQDSTTFTGNTAGSEGGALSVYGTLQATHCTFNSNHATFGGGGAITIVDGASATVDTTTFTGNTASASVGGHL